MLDDRTARTFSIAMQIAQEMGILKQGDLVVQTAGTLTGISGSTDLIKVSLVRKVVTRGISIGEKSEFSTDSIMVGSSNTGVSVKDLSVLNIRKAKITNTKICIEAVQKKQEFGGGLAKIVE